jgi:MFS family permease
VTAEPPAAWRVIAWMCAAHVLSMTPFAAYPALLPVLQDEWALSNSLAGLISGLFFAGYMCAVPVLTALTDRIDARRVYLVSALVAGVASLGFGFLANGPWSAGFFQVLGGVGVAGTYMPGLKALTDNTRGGAQARAVSFYTALFGLGMGVSLALAGWVGGTWGWRAAFVVSALGPPLAAAMVVLGLPRRDPAPAPGRRLLDFGGVLGDRRINGFIFGYAVHAWELFGLRSWLVAFLTFAQGTGAWPLAPVAIAAIANLTGPFGSILGNEVAIRRGRVRVIRAGMAASACVTIGLGFLADAPWWVLAGIALVHLPLIMSDSSALTAGLVQNVAPERRGAAMGIHSTFGFGAGFVAPVVFGAVLDAAGGNASGGAWAAAFASLGVLGLAGAVLLRLPRDRQGA